MDLGRGLGHLTYSTLVHPADDWPQLWDSLNQYLPQVKKRISPNAPFGVCIRLSHLTAAELSSKKAEREKLKAFLKDQDLYVYTANAFVYGVFKNTQIKEQVYEPDWRTPERREYTKQVADILADICPAWATPSIQTAPLGQTPGHRPDMTRSPRTSCGSSRTWSPRADDRKAADARARAEPRCHLERLTRRSLTSTSISTPGNPRPDSPSSPTSRWTRRSRLRRHLGVVFDIGHQAVGFETSLVAAELVDAGIPIVKLRKRRPYASARSPTKIEALQRFAKTIYLSDRQCHGDHLEHYLNLEDAFRAGRPTRRRASGTRIPRPGVSRGLRSAALHAIRT
jgi:hypothetical protein